MQYASLISKSNLHYPGEDKMIVNMLMEHGADVTIQTQGNTTATSSDITAQTKTTSGFVILEFRKDKAWST